MRRRNGAASWKGFFALVAAIGLWGVSSGSRACDALAGDEPREGRQVLYVTNSAGNDVTVVDVATNEPIGRIEVGPNPHGIAVPASEDVIWVTIEGGHGELVAIDPSTNEVTRRIDIGPAPNELAVTPDGRLAYIPVEDGHWEVVDLEAGEIIARIPVGGRPHNTVCSPDGRRMYLAPMGDVRRVLIADTATHEIIGEIPFSDVVRPVVLSRDEARFYAQVDGLIGFEVADVQSRQVIHRVEAVLSAEQQQVASRSHGIGITPDGRELWMCDVEHHQVIVFSLEEDEPRQIATIAMGDRVYWLCFTPDGRTCYVSVRGANEVAAVDTETKEIVARIPVGEVPKRLLVITLGE